METLNTLSKQEIKNFIVENQTKSITEIANELGLSVATIRANYAWLVRDNIIQKTATKTTKKASFTSLKDSVDKISKSINKVDKLYDKIKKDSKNTYHNHEGENKQTAREKMVKAIVDSGVFGIVPTLPNTEWTIEKMIDNQTKGNSFIGVERDLATYKKMKANLKALKKQGLFGSTLHGDIAQVIYGKNESTYAHVILDYCGNLVTFKNEINHVIQNNILAVNGIMAVTFSKPIRGIDNESLKLLGLAPTNNTDTRCDSDRAIEAYFNKITGFTHKVEEFFYYRDTYPMTLVIIKRVK